MPSPALNFYTMPKGGTDMDRMTVLREAAEALAQLDAAKIAHKAADERVRLLCRQYDTAAGVWGFQEHHLRRACEEFGTMEKAA